MSYHHNKKTKLSSKFYDFVKKLQYNPEKVKEITEDNPEHNLLPQRTLKKSVEQDTNVSPVKKVIDNALKYSPRLPKEMPLDNAQKKVQIKISSNQAPPITAEKALKAELIKLQSEFEIQKMLQKTMEEELLVNC